jgi:hypothetical protein
VDKLWNTSREKSYPQQATTSGGTFPQTCQANKASVNKQLRIESSEKADTIITIFLFI